MHDSEGIGLGVGGKTEGTVDGSIFFIGNATVLIRCAGFTILTDPTFIHMHEKTWLGYGLDTTRLTNPAIEISDLPPLDLVLLSHFHGDHFDQVAERELAKDLLIVTTGQSSRKLHERGFANTRALDTWESISFTKGDARIAITATPGRHGPPLSDHVMPDVMGSILDVQPASGVPPYRIYISGDTLVYDDIREIPRRFPDVDLALLHLGGTEIFGILVTMDGKQGVEMIQIIGPRLAIPIHYSDYDVFKSPLSDFQNEVKAAGLEDRVHYLSHGDTFEFRVQGWPTEPRPSILAGRESLQETDPGSSTSIS